MKLKITINGKTYEVDVEVSEPEAPNAALIPRPSAIGHPPSAIGDKPIAESRLPKAAAVDETTVCRSPISGVVVRVAAQVGQAIQVNDVLLVLEAMKMETVITSSIAGKVSKINANVGDAVQAGQVLVEFEALGIGH